MGLSYPFSAALSRGTLSHPFDSLGSSPVFDIDFAGTESLIPTKGSGLSITRTGGATRVGPTGLVEFAPENLLLHAERIDLWTAQLVGATRTDEGVGPDGGTIWRVDQTGGPSGGTNIYRDCTKIPAGFPFTFGVWARKVSGADSTLGLQYYDNVSGTRKTDYVLTSEWQFITLEATRESGSTLSRPALVIGISDMVYEVCAARITRGAESDFLPNDTGSSVFSPRIDYDPATLECLGYLHETQSTNLLTTSNPTEWSDTGMVATAAGTILGQPARALVPTAVNESHRVFAPGATTTSGSTYTRSFYVKSDDFQYFRIREGAISGRVASFDLIAGTCSATSGATAIMQDCGNGVFRCSYVDTHNGTTSAIQIGFDNGEVNNPLTAWTGDGVSVGYVAMGQTERRRRASSYIPTYGSTINRTQDSARVASADFINADEGTLFGDFVPVGNAAEVGDPQGFIGLDSSVRTYGSIAFGNSSFANLSRNYVTGPAAWESSFYSYVTMPSGRLKMALTYQHDKPSVGDFAAQAALNGVATALDTVGQRPVNALSQLVIGANGFTSGPQACSAHFRTVSYYKKRLSESQLESLTAL